MKIFFIINSLMLSLNYAQGMNPHTAPTRPSIAAPEAYLQELKDSNTSISQTFTKLVKTIWNNPNNYTGNPTDLATASHDLNNLMALINTMYEAKVLREKLLLQSQKNFIVMQ